MNSKPSLRPISTTMSTRDKSRPDKAAPRTEQVLHGIGVSPGVVEAIVFVAGGETEGHTERIITAKETPREVARFEEAMIETRRQLKELQKNLMSQLAHGDPGILDAHLMVLDDRTLVEQVLIEIRDKHRNTEAALWDVCSRYADALAGVEDDYLRERVADIKDVARRIIRNLTGGAASALAGMKEKCIVVAHDIAPSETAALPRHLVLGFATDMGSPTSHSAMMARAMEIPAVVGMHDITRKVVTGDRILMDGNKGVVIVEPTTARLEMYGKVVAVRRHIQSGLTSLKDEPAVTRDGIRIKVMANIEMPDDVDAVLAYGAEGVGLLRSEYLYMAAQDLPSEDQLTASYKLIVDRLSHVSVSIRTLDMGGDKFAPYSGRASEPNPFLGRRSIRISLSEPEVFKTQLRAILRSSIHHNVKIMYPMISGVEELVKANELLSQAKAELRAKGHEFDESIEVGAMIEVPSAALTADLLASHVRFFSIGTNDLVQYTIAVDRVNEQVAYLYQPTHPAILKLLAMTVNAGHGAGLKTSVCGEMSSDPVLCPLLVGLGVDEISVPPSAVPVVKDAIRSVTSVEAKALAASAVCAKSSAEVLQQCRTLISRTAPEILELTS